jgi:putative membrane protein insertion efficiency factor
MNQCAVALLSAPIRLYRLVLSPLLPHACRFTPSCSVYALEALRLHGPIKGLWLAARRLSRCHPITWLGGSSGPDPVPLPSISHPKACGHS